MRLTFVPDDSVVIIDGVIEKIDTTQLDVPEHLHAIQYYNADDIECEWSDARGAMGNSFGVAGLANGSDFIAELVRLHAESVNAKEALKNTEEPVVNEDE